QRLPEALEQVLVENAQHDAHVGVEGADLQGGGDVEQVVAGDDEDAAAVAHAGRFEHLDALAVAAYEAGVAQTRVGFGAGGVDDDNGDSRSLQVGEDAPADAAQAAKKDGWFHDETSEESCGGVVAATMIKQVAALYRYPSWFHGTRREGLLLFSRQQAQA